MKDKFDFFKTIESETNQRREILLNIVKDYMRILAVALGASIFFFNQKSTPISLSGNRVDWYNFFLVINIMLLLVFASLAIFCFLRGVKYKGYPQPKEINNHWKSVEIYLSGLMSSDADYSKNVLAVVKEDFVVDMVQDIQFNDEQNSKLDTNILILKILFTGIILTYILMMLKVFQL